MTIPIFPTTWYWVVSDTNPTTQVWESATGAFVANNAANYLSWILNGGTQGLGNQFAVTGAANNGSGLIRLTVSTTVPMATNDSWIVQNVGGTTEANGTWAITVIDATHVDLQGSTFTHAFTSNGVIDRGTVIDTAANLYALINTYNVSLWAAGGNLSVNTTLVPFGTGLQQTVTLTNPLAEVQIVSPSNTGSIGLPVNVILPAANLFGSFPKGLKLLISNQLNDGFNHSATINVYCQDTITQVGSTIPAPGGALQTDPAPAALIELSNNTTANGTWQFQQIQEAPLKIVHGGMGGKISPSVGQIPIAISTTEYRAATMGGDATITSVGVVTVTKVNNNSPIHVADGGTGAATLTAHSVLLGEGTSALAFATIGTAGRLLLDQGAGADPSFNAMSGDATIAAGGTLTIGAAAVTYAKIQNVAAGLTALGRSSNSSGSIQEMAGTANQVLVVNNAGTSLGFGQVNLGAAAAITGTLGVGNGGTGTATSLTQGSVVFAGASGVYSQDNSNFFWDGSNHRLGLGVASPGYFLDAEHTDGFQTFTDANGINRSITNLFKETVTTAISPTLGAVLALDTTTNFSSAPGAQTIHGLRIVTNGQTSNPTTSMASVTLRGLNFIATYNGTATGGSALTGCDGLLGAARNLNTGTITTAQSGNFSLQNSGNGTITTAYGIQIAQPSGGTTGTWGNIYGIFFNDQKPSGSDTLTNPPEAIHIASQTATGAYAINQQGSGLVYFNSPINSGAFSRVSSQFDKTNDSSLANITGLTATLVAGNSYFFRAVLFVTANITAGQKYAIGGTCTATAIVYEIAAVSNAANTIVISSKQTALGGSAGQAGSTDDYTTIEGLITVNAAGTLTVQFAQNVATPAVTSSVLVGSFFEVYQVT